MMKRLDVLLGAITLIAFAAPSPASGLFVGDTYKAIKNKVKSGMNWVRKKATQAKNWARKKATQAKNWVQRNAQQAKTWVRNKTTQAKNWVQRNAQQAKTWVRNKATQAKNWVQRNVKKAKTWVRNKATQAKNWVQRNVKKAKTWVRNAGRYVRDKAHQAGRWLKEKGKKVVKYLKNHLEEGGKMLIRGGKTFWKGMKGMGRAAKELVRGNWKKAKDEAVSSVENMWDGATTIQQGIAVPGQRELMKDSHDSLKSGTKGFVDGYGKLIDAGKKLFDGDFKGALKTAIEGRIQAALGAAEVAAEIVPVGKLFKGAKIAAKIMKAGNIGSKLFRSLKRLHGATKRYAQKLWDKAKRFVRDKAKNLAAVNDWLLAQGKKVAGKASGLARAALEKALGPKAASQLIKNFTEAGGKEVLEKLYEKAVPEDVRTVISAGGQLAKGDIGGALKVGFDYFKGLFKDAAKERLKEEVSKPTASAPTTKAAPLSAAPVGSRPTTGLAPPRGRPPGAPAYRRGTPATGRSYGRSAGRSYGRSAGRSYGRSTGRSYGRSTGRSYGRSTGRSYGRSRPATAAGTSSRYKRAPYKSNTSRSKSRYGSSSESRYRPPYSRTRY